MNSQSDIIKVMVISNEAIKTEWVIGGNEIEEVVRYVYTNICDWYWIVKEYVCFGRWAQIFWAERKYQERLKWNFIKLSSLSQH